MKMSKKEKTVLTKTQKRSLFRWFLNGGASLNYERMMSMAYTYSMLPWLKENYKGNPEGLKKSVKTHLQYYNCSPYMNPYVMGVNMGIEGQGKENSLDAVMAIKTGLMGPLSGLGDSVFVVIPWTIFGAIAANMALNGSVAGIFIWILVTWILKGLGYPLFKAGIASGTSLVNSIETKMKVLKECVAVLGLTVVGALMPTVVKANVALTFKTGRSENDRYRDPGSDHARVNSGSTCSTCILDARKESKTGMDYLNDHCCIYLMCSIWNFKIIKKKGR